MHVACRNLDAANELLAFSRKIFRRAGIIGITNRRVMIEIFVENKRKGERFLRIMDKT